MDVVRLRPENDEADDLIGCAKAYTGRRSCQGRQLSLHRFLYRPIAILIYPHFKASRDINRNHQARASLFQLSWPKYDLPSVSGCSPDPVIPALTATAYYLLINQTTYLSEEGCYFSQPQSIKAGSIYSQTELTLR